ncbi:MAG: tRNA 2-selenouridine(34) synthase MnmH [Bacillota bacterium]
MEKITYKEALKKKSVVFVDARSPAEYKESTIPNSINLPLLNNKERKIVGTIYTKESPAKAKMKGVELVSPKLPQLISKIRELRANYNYVIIFCSRGGLRSESLITFAELAGLKTFQLKGGYKAYRHFILNQLKSYNINSKFIVIHGNTGVGKTELLYKLKERGINIIDIEGLANHRGSVFGGIGLNKARNQKMFDSLLWEKLEKIKNSNFIAVEAENRRIGMSNLPDFFVRKMENGIHILIESSPERRVKRIYNEYTTSYKKNKEKFIENTLDSLNSIKKYLLKNTTKKKYKNLVNLLKKGNLKKAIEILLKDYYDPMYKHKQKKQKNYALKIKNDNIDIITKKTLKYLKNL